MALLLIYIFYGGNDHFPNEYISENFLYFGYLLAFFCQIVFFRACTVGPGIITEKKVANLEKKYPYDNIYYKKEDCKKCNITKSEIKIYFFLNKI
jgi:hypothetical protein